MWCCSHLANTVAIRHTAAGAGCWFWLDPVLVHSGCCGQGSASVIVFFHTISTHSHLLRSGLYFFDHDFNLRRTRTACNFLGASAALTSHFVLHFRACASASQCSPLIRCEFSFFSFNFFPFNISVEHFTCAVDTPLSSGSSGPRLFGVLVLFRNWSTSCRYIFSISERYLWAQCPTPHLCCVSVHSSRSCLPMSSSVRPLHLPPSNWSLYGVKADTAISVCHLRVALEVVFCQSYSQSSPALPIGVFERHILHKFETLCFTSSGKKSVQFASDVVPARIRQRSGTITVFRYRQHLLRFRCFDQ